MNTNFLKLKKILTQSLKSPIQLKFSPETIIISKNKILILKINLTSKNIIEIKFEITYYPDNSYSKENIQIIEIIFNLLRQNNIQFHYNELELKQYKEFINLKLNPNYKHTSDVLGKCSKANNYYYNIFNPKSLDFRKGILLYHNSQLIGVLKLVLQKKFEQEYNIENNQKTFLSFKMPDNNIPLEELTIYNSSKELYLKIKEKININKILNRRFLERLKTPKWKKVNIIGQFPINKNGSEYLLKDIRITKMDQFRFQTDNITINEFKLKFIQIIKSEYEKNKNNKKFDAEIKL